MTPAILLFVLAVGPEVSSGTVTLPLTEARSLLSTKEEPAAPISAAVISQRLVGQVTGDSLEVTATFQITVLEAERWSRLSLIKLDPNVTLLDATSGGGMLITAHLGDVAFVSRQPGTYSVELKLSVRGTGSPVHVAQLTRGNDAREGILHVETATAAQSLEHGADVLSSGGPWVVRWKGTAQTSVAAARPPMEPVVSSSRVQVVSTVEGRARMTVEYRLGLDREQPLALKLPADWTLTRLNVNSTPRTVPQGREIAIVVTPQSAGGREGLVELTLERDFGVFHLSGKLNFSLPGASWPTAVVDASVHLPNVFEYRRLGGSLEPSDSAQSTQESLPGRALHFRQHLVASAGPTLELSYSVDLTNRYFRVRH
jgi:hypothetical protein